MMSNYWQRSVWHFQHFFALVNSLGLNGTINRSFSISHGDLYSLSTMVSYFNFLHPKPTPSEKVFLFHFPSHLIQPAQSLLYNFSFNGTQSQIQIHYSVAHMVPLIATGFSATPHKHCYLSASISKDTAVIHFVIALQILHSKREFQ